MKIIVFTALLFGFSKAQSQNIIEWSENYKLELSDFDLAELYGRKFRKKLFENKGAFSNVSFFQPIYNENQKEYAEKDDQAGQEAEIGGNKVRMKKLHDEVLKELHYLADFCKTCTPPKKKK